jgi:acetoacetate decarboxylase
MSQGKGFAFEAGKPYIMPAHFGTATQGWDGEKAHYADNTALTVLYATDARKASRLLPPGFAVADPAVVSVSFVMCRGVDFMAGGGYNLVAVNLAARFEGKRDRAEGSFSLVLWENDFFPIVLGREVLGAPKLFGYIPDAWQRDGKEGFSVSEYGTLLLEGTLWDLKEAAEAERAQVQAQVDSQLWMGWKYVPACDLRGADASFATALPAANGIERAWLGKGEVLFHPTAWERAPLSHRVVQALAGLPVEQGLGAVKTRGWQDLLISRQHPLE